MQVSAFISELNEVYSELRKQYTDTWSEYDTTNEKLLELSKHRNEYSAQGFEERAQKLRRELREHLETIYGIPRTFQSESKSIRNKLEKTFSDKYGVTPENVDSNALAILSSGICTESELYKLASKYENNRTMSRFIAKAMTEQGEREENEQLRTTGAALLSKSYSQPHLELFDHFSEMCAHGLRSGEESGDSGAARAMSEGYAERLHAEMYSKSYAAGEKISN